jgi:predicted membrane channel-forming protein YqfA (hemolysin III family)
MGMDTPSHPPFRPFLVAAIVLFLLGAGLFFAAVIYLEPTVWSRWVFFFGGTLALTAMALPATWFLNLRFPSTPPAEAHIIVRQAAWVGVFGGLLAWLQQERLVSLGIFVGLGLGLFVIEYLIRMRERSLWRPPKEEESNHDDQPA